MMPSLHSIFSVLSASSRGLPWPSILMITAVVIAASWLAIEWKATRAKSQRSKAKAAQLKASKCPKCGGRTIIAVRTSGVNRGKKYRACVSSRCKGSRAYERAARIRTRNAKAKAAR